jgi:hypothetical protein
MDVETFCSAIAPLLKEQGFKKQRLNWRKDLGASIGVLNVQISPWGDRSYNVNVGVYLKALGEESSPPHNRCHVQERLSHESAESAVREAIDWFSQRADIACLARLHNEGRLQGKGLVFKEVISAIAA